MQSDITVSLEQETRATVNTETAAFHLNRKPQTLRIWSSRGDGPIKPIVVHGRLAWPTNEIRKLLGMAEKA